MMTKRLARAVEKAKDALSDDGKRAVNAIIQEMHSNDREIVRRREEINSVMALLKNAPNGIVLSDKALKGLRNEIKENGSRMMKTIEENTRSRRELKHLARTGFLPKHADEALQR